ncbi:ATP-binding cassette subfamily C protein CydD [Labedaea rhizosphaerae]|uniref:ATP-binding cassette subfamily C protein CydD n=1 Tax=Labedaea rhizosphaerae TaxID=598644 RepID=A0A4R6S3C9_LABRH|nr:ATP-binding cassette subfamily C protein CydD [Labedaea rhizosphaerae]
MDGAAGPGVLVKDLPLGRYPLWLAVLSVAGAAVVITQAWTLAGALLGGAVLPVLVVIAVRAGLHFVRTSVAAHATSRITHVLRMRALSSAESPGRVATVVTRGVDAVVPYVTGYLPQLAACAVVPVAVLVAVAVADPLSALTIGVTLPLIPVFAVLVGKHTKASTKHAWAGTTRLGGHFADVVRGLDTLTVYGRARRQERTVRALATAHAHATMRTLRVAFLSALVLELVATLSVAMVAVPVGLRLLDGSIPAHTAVFVLLLTPEAYLPLRAAGAAFHASAEGLEALPPVPPPVTAVTRPPDLRHATIELDRVTVRRGDVDALHEVSLTIAPGRHYAITGPNGAGKSTLLAVLLGLLPPTSGRVLVDGVDLRVFDHAAWCAQLSWIPQRPWLTEGTVASNVVLGRPDASPAEVAAACSTAHLPVATSTPVTRLSTGERQRVALARALLRTQAPLLLLDEPTERLDSTTEQAVVSSLVPLLHNRTAVVVAHRPLIHQALHDPVPIHLDRGRVALAVG